MKHPDLRHLDLDFRQQQHRADLQQLQHEAQLSRTPHRARLAQVFRVMADLLDGRARIMLVYPDGLKAS